MDKDKIINHFGIAFYNKVITDLKKYSELWNLSELNQIDYYSVNCIFECVSDKYGLCILKIGRPSKEVITEYNTLREYNGRFFCRVYESDITNGVLLIERIAPGTQLRAEVNLDKRLDIFCDLLRSMHIKINTNADYPTYMEWVSDITKSMEGYTEYRDLYKKMAKAEKICRTLYEKYADEMLLHGDLHHDNILLDKDNQYRIIDPKGVIGNSVFDIPRFIINEFDDMLDEGFYRKYTHITQKLSENLKIPEYDIRCLTYIEICMANCWSADSGQKIGIEDMNAILFTEKLMNEIRGV